MVIESSQQPVKRGRGRPRKVQPTSHTSSVSHATSKKPHAHASVLSREEELAAFEKRSNKSGVLTLLVLLLGIALIGYGMYLKLHQADEDDQQQKISSTKTVAMEKTPTTTPSTPKPTPSQPAPSSTSPNTIIQDYFSRINNGQFDTLSTLEDSSFKNIATLRNYFNVDRLQTFSKNITGWIRVDGLVAVTNDPAIQRNPNAKAYDFFMVYTLKSDEKEYREPWRAYTVSRENGTVINGFVYEWTGVTQSPFFQFNKYWIK